MIEWINEWKVNLDDLLQRIEIKLRKLKVMSNGVQVIEIKK